mmetsp:Transcript_105372/g.295260  ORF Transcript_105372/g.295260 Transcript_105372/m.295260 type:complete len:220 (+) Transcript_105372:606-1265(+)
MDFPKGCQTTGPARSQIPILVAILREVGIVLGRIGNVTNVKHNIVHPLEGPVWIKLGDDSGGINVITIVIMMIVVISISKINIDIRQGGAFIRCGVTARSFASGLAFGNRVVTATIDQSTPRLVVHVRSFGQSIDPNFHGIPQHSQGRFDLVVSGEFDFLSSLGGLLAEFHIDQCGVVQGLAGSIWIRGQGFQFIRNGNDSSHTGQNFARKVSIGGTPE